MWWKQGTLKGQDLQTVRSSYKNTIGRLSKEIQQQNFFRWKGNMISDLRKASCKMHQMNKNWMNFLKLLLPPCKFLHKCSYCSYRSQIYNTFSNNLLQTARNMELTFGLPRLKVSILFTPVWYISVKQQFLIHQMQVTHYDIRQMPSSDFFTWMYEGWCLHCSWAASTRCTINTGHSKLHKENTCTIINMQYDLTNLERTLFQISGSQNYISFFKTSIFFLKN
jgi:hypothetical protein